MTLTGSEFYYCVVCSAIEAYIVGQQPTDEYFTDMELQWLRIPTSTEMDESTDIVCNGIPCGCSCSRCF
jgi:hypothetical protein